MWGFVIDFNLEIQLMKSVQGIEANNGLCLQCLKCNYVSMYIGTF